MYVRMDSLEAEESLAFTVVCSRQQPQLKSVLAVNAQFVEAN